MRCAEFRNAKTARGSRVVMLLENHSYPEDSRVRNEAEALVRAGHDVVVIAPARAGQPVRERISGVAVRRFSVPVSSGSRTGYLLEYLVAHVHLFARVVGELARGAGVVHLHNPPDTLFPAACLARLLGRRAVYDLHDAAPELFIEKFGGSRLVTVLRAAQRASLRSADAVLVTNEPQRELAAQDAAAVTVVRNGPRRAVLDRARPGRTGPLANPRLLFVGNLEVQDGVLILPTVLASLQRDHGLPGAQLTVAGDGLCLGELAALAERQGVAASLHLLGRIEHDRVPALIAEVDICLEPAPCSPLNHATSMIKVSEYLAGGRPVVAFALEETRRTARDAALYADCDDPAGLARRIAELARDGNRRGELAQRAGELATELVWERSEEALLRVYRELAR